MAAYDELKARAAEFPAKPGIYFFKNASGEVVYIGKARSLRDRVRSYFLPNPDIKVRNILRDTADIDFILTGSEREAAFLENNYVQQHQPRFNLRLKDDKSFPYLKLRVGETFPGVYFSRRVEDDGSRYFGPYSPAHRARSSIHLVNKHFLVRGGAKTRSSGTGNAPASNTNSSSARRPASRTSRKRTTGRTSTTPACSSRAGCPSWPGR